MRALLHRSISAFGDRCESLCWQQKRRGILPCPQRVKAMFLSHLIGVYRQWRRYNQSVRELNRLGDRELADIGISRGDIHRIAWESSERC
jgi:uncharacterized protein YjiS (DUF1127 family)